MSSREDEPPEATGWTSGVTMTFYDKETQEVNLSSILGFNINFKKESDAWLLSNERERCEYNIVAQWRSPCGLWSCKDLRLTAEGWRSHPRIQRNSTTLFRCPTPPDAGEGSENDQQLQQR